MDTQHGPSQETSEPARTLREEICPQCLTPIHPSEGICLECGTCATSDSTVPTAGSVGPTTAPRVTEQRFLSERKPEPSSMGTGRLTTESRQVICDELLRLGVRYSVDHSLLRTSPLRSLPSSSSVRDTNRTRTTGSTRPAISTSSNAYTRTARRYLADRHATLLAKCNLSDDKDFEKAVECLGGVLKECLFPNPELDLG